MYPEIGVSNMIAGMLKDIKVFNLEYDRNKHTFMITWGPKDSTSPTQRTALTGSSFPTMSLIEFLDEKVKIYEEVMVWLKDESILKAEGWEEYRDGRRLRSDQSPFVIGKEKRRLLGTGIKARIGVTENMIPYAFYKDWRFSPAEIKTLLKLDFAQPLRYAELATSDGMLTVMPEVRQVMLPDGHIIPTGWLYSLKQICRMAGV